MAVGGSVFVRISFLFVLATVVFGGDFIVVHSPNTVHFVPDAKDIDTVEVAPLIAASLGFGLNKDLKWDGLEEVSMFQRPKASAVIVVTGLPDERLELSNVASYKTIERSNDVDIDHLFSHIEKFDWKAEPLLVDFSSDVDTFDIRTHYSDIFASLPTTVAALNDDVNTGAVTRWFGSKELASLNMTQDADMRFVGELYMMQEILNLLHQNKDLVKTRSPDIFHFKITGLELLAQSYGRDSVQFGDAVRLLRRVIGHVSGKMQELYGPNYVLQVVTFTPAASVKLSSRRHGRSLKEDPSAASEPDLGLAPKFTENYAALFNIVLWSMIAFSLAIFFVSWGMWNMDPGRDSIIYRMTSQRMKRD